MKLSAYGRTVVAQVSKVTELTNALDGSPVKVRTEYALLSERTLAVKRTYLKADGRVHFSDGWKRMGKVRRDAIVGWADRKVADGYTLVKS